MKIRILNSGTQIEVQQIDLDRLLAEGESCFVGRSHQSGLVLDSPNVSRLHGQLIRREGQIYFSDLGSTNGSMVQDQIAAVNQDYLLYAGSRVYIGGFTLLFEDWEDAVQNHSATEINKETSTETNTETHEPDELLETALNSAAESLELIKAEIIPDAPGAIVPYQSGSITPSLESKTRALLHVIGRRAIADLRTTGKFTREAFLIAAQTARESIEDHIDQEQLEQEIEKYWQSMTRNTAVLSTRLGAAAKAAWKEFVAPQEIPAAASEADSKDMPAENASADSPAAIPPANPAADSNQPAIVESEPQDEGNGR